MSCQAQKILRTVLKNGRFKVKGKKYVTQKLKLRILLFLFDI